MKVCIIGLGSMGFGMASALLRDGFAVTGYDLNAEAVTRLAALGGRPAQSLAEAARGADVVLCVVVNAAQTEAVLFGAQGAAAVMAAGGVILSCATMAPEAAAGFAAKAEAAGLTYLDAPISGGAVRAASGDLTIMASGKARAFAQARPVLDSIAAKVYELGEAAGTGAAFKVVNQLLAGVHIAAAAEAMALGLREGVDPAALYEVITHSAGNSWMFENRMAHVLAADYTPLSAVDIFVKDLGLVLDMARASKFPLPLSSTAHQMFMQASTAGFAREDDSAVIKIFPGIELPKKP